MITKEKVPMRCSAIETGVEKQMTSENHLVPIVTHYPKHSKHAARKKRYKLVWTPVNAALFVLLIAAMVFMLVRAIAVDPLQQQDLITMSYSVLRA